MSRIIDSVELFGGSIGSSTGCEVKCEWCGTIHNKGLDVDKGYTEGVSVLNTTFAGKMVCDCCFEEIENEVLSRIDTIADWYEKIIKMREERIKKAKNNIKKLKGR